MIERQILYGDVPKRLKGPHSKCGRSLIPTRAKTMSASSGRRSEEVFGAVVGFYKTAEAGRSKNREPQGCQISPSYEKCSKKNIYGDVPKWLKGPHSKCGRLLTATREFKSLHLRQRITVILIQRNGGYFIPKISISRTFGESNL